MPKVLVLFDNRDQRAERLAELAIEGAKKIRFTEVDVRVISDDASSDGARRKRFEPADAVNQYDGVVIAGSDHEASAAIDALLAGRDGSANGEFANHVFALVTEGEPAYQRLTALGGIVVTPPPGLTDAEQRARKMGERVAKVAEWVRHALSHEH